MRHRGGGRGFVAAADIAPGALLLVERRFFPMPSPRESSLAGGVAQVRDNPTHANPTNAWHVPVDATSKNRSLYIFLCLLHFCHSLT